MITRIRKNLVKSVLICLAWFFCFPDPAHAQTNLSVQLKTQKFPFEPKEFYINKTFDIREDRTSIGQAVIPGSSQQLLKRSLNFQGNADYELSKFFSENLRKQADLRPVNIRLQKLRILEESKTGSVVSGTVEISMLFELDREAPVKLYEYSGGMRYTRSVQQLSSIDQVLATSIINSVKYFNTWINREADINEKFAKKVVLVFADKKTLTTGDTVFYSADKKLTWMDFKSTPEINSRFAAEIFPFFSYEQSSETVQGVIKIRIIPKVYMVKSFSWVKGYARTPYTLDHEQRHFDIVKIAEERFKKKINNEKLTVDNYQGILSMEYLQILREMNAMQKEYDNDTKHGSDSAMQNKWNNRIDSELRSYYISRVNTR